MGDAARRGLQHAHEIFDRDQRLVQKAGIELAAESVGHLAHSLADVFGVEAEIFIQLIAGKDGEIHALVLAGVLASEEFTSPFLRKPVFRLAPGQWSVPELVRFVRAQLLLAKL